MEKIKTFQESEGIQNKSTQNSSCNGLMNSSAFLNNIGTNASIPLPAT